MLPCLPPLSLVFLGVYLCQPSYLKTSVEVRLYAQCWAERTKQVPCYFVLCAVSVSKKNAGLGSFSCCSVCSRLCTHTALGLLCFLRNAFPFRSTSAHGSQLDQPGLSSMLLVAITPVFCSQMLCFLTCFFSLYFSLLFI